MVGTLLHLVWRGYREQGCDVFHPANEYLGVADGVLLADLAHANLQPGRTENEFQVAIRTLRAAIPIGIRLQGGTGRQ